MYLHDISYTFRQNNAILREQLGSFLSYFNVNTVGGKSEYNKYEQKTVVSVLFPSLFHIFQDSIF
jgi:hypothetical protein